MTLGSLFDGIGVFCLAAQNAGIKPVWASEIEAFPLSVTARHFPDTVQLGDINTITDAPHVDIITAGNLYRQAYKYLLHGQIKLSRQPLALESMPLSICVHVHAL